jgi:hypothetical protein
MLAAKATLWGLQAWESYQLLISRELDLGDLKNVTSTFIYFLRVLERKSIIIYVPYFSVWRRRVVCDFYNLGTCLRRHSFWAQHPLRSPAASD